MIIKREVYPQLKEKLESGKVIILYGPRQVGKTFLLDKLKKEFKTKEKVLSLNGESTSVQDNLSERVPEKLKRFVGDASLLIIDEAHQIPKIGLVLKMIVDSLPNLKVVVSGSASFTLAQKVNEPLTGRRKTFYLYPVSAQELIKTKDNPFYQSIRNHHIIFGGYPELFKLEDIKKQKRYLYELVDSYLFREILTFQKVRGAKKLRDLLALLAFQIGNEVSLSELSNSLNLNWQTVEHYLDLLEKSFVIVNVRGFSRNLRKEVTKTSRYYFWDNGVRNAIIKNFNSLRLRNDVGMLWENYLVIERIKKQKYNSIYSNNYFWRTYDQKEIDWVEEREGKLFGFEIKWGKEKSKVPRDWKETYKNSEYKLINQDNFLDFIA